MKSDNRDTQTMQRRVPKLRLQEYDELLPLIQESRQKVFSQVNTALYVDLCRREQNSSRELERQIDSVQFGRTIMGQIKLSAVLRELHPSIGGTFKDIYVLEFLGLPLKHSGNKYQLQMPDKKLLQTKLHELAFTEQVDNA